MASTQVKGAQILDATITDTDIAAANTDGVAGVPSIRTLGTGAQQAAAGNHTHTATDVLLLSAVPSTDLKVSGLTMQLAANEAQTFGDACFIASDGEAQLIDANAIATMSAVVMVADATIGIGATGNYLLHGIARRDAWAWTVGGIIYGSTVGTTTNTLTQTQPSGTNDVVQIIGVATHADRMLFAPQLVQVEHT